LDHHRHRRLHIVALKNVQDATEAAQVARLLREVRALIRRGRPQLVDLLGHRVEELARLAVPHRVRHVLALTLRVEVGGHDVAKVVEPQHLLLEEPEQMTGVRSREQGGKMCDAGERSTCERM